jgi:hypothetical protein
MSNNSLSLNPETLEKLKIEAQEQRRTLHNNLLQRILKLRDKLSSTASLTQISHRLNEMEMEIYSGCELKDIEVEINGIEKIVGSYIQSFLQFMIHHQTEVLESKTSLAIHQARDVNNTEKA